MIETLATGIAAAGSLLACHNDASARADDYWFGYIVKAQKTTKIKVSVEIHGQDLSKLQSAWVQVNYVTYGPGGRIPKVRHVVVPLQFPNSETVPNARNVGVAEVLPIRTHILTELDHPVEIVKRYVLPRAQKGLLPASRGTSQAD